MCMQRGMAQLPDLHVSDSSEAMLSGRKPPFRLLVRAVASDGRKVNIRHAVSEGFVVRFLHTTLILHCDVAPISNSGQAAPSIGQLHLLLYAVRLVREREGRLADCE